VKAKRLIASVSILGAALGACARDSQKRESSAAAQVVLPKPAPSFSGKIGPTYKESTPDFPKPVAAPEGAPNVLLILTDDTGFGHAATFGGAAATPTLDRLAASGLRYNRLHTRSTGETSASTPS
jgi:Sulfatase